MSFFLLAPVTLLTEGVKVTPTVLQSAVSTLIFNYRQIAPYILFGVIFDYFLSYVGSELKTDIHKVTDCCVLFPCIPTGQPSN